MKAWMLAQGAGDYWSDQPPLLTFIHSVLLDWFGPSLVSLRIVAVGFSVLLCVALFQILSRFYGWFAGFICIALLVLSSDYLMLSVSCLVGLPAYAFAMVACACSIRSTYQNSVPYALLSGIFLGLGALTKMSALLALPALVLRFACWRPKDTSPKFSPATLAQWWLSGFGVVFLGFCYLRPDMLVVLAATHWGSSTRSAFQDYPSSPETIFSFMVKDWLLTILALSGLFIGIRRRTWAVFLPAIWFGVALLVQLWHRPFWSHHTVNLFTPMAWLAGVFVGESTKSLTLGHEGGQLEHQSHGSDHGDHGFVQSYSLNQSSNNWLSVSLGKLSWLMNVRYVAVICLSLIVAGIFWLAPEKLSREATILKQDDLKDWECVEIMKQYKIQTRWVFTDHGLYPFYAGMLVPPEIAVLSYKRLKAGLITQPELLNLLVHYHAEQVLVRRHVFDEKFMVYVGQHYTSVFEYGSLQLYVRNDLVKGKGVTDAR